MADAHPYARYAPSASSGPYAPFNNARFATTGGSSLDSHISSDQLYSSASPSTTPHAPLNGYRQLDWPPQHASSSMAAFALTDHDAQSFINPAAAPSFTTYTPYYPQARPTMAIELPNPRPPSPVLPPQPQPQVASSASPSASEPPAPSVSPPQRPPREKRHKCNMCFKSFDRPSTLKKHFLVHTGEKAYQCETCERRFGVASNLNRHAKRCILRPVNAIKSSADPNAQPDSSPQPSMLSASPSLPATTASSTSSSAGPIRRGRTNISTVDAASGAVTPSSAPAPSARPRRSRRAPTPDNWIPLSLKCFNLQPYKKACPVPLAPVAPSNYCSDASDEERDSYLPFSDRPYHPSEWRGRLPGPALLGQEMTRNLGRLVVF